LTSAPIDHVRGACKFKDVADGGVNLIWEVKIMVIYTSNLKYTGMDRLNVSRAGKDVVGLTFAPSWDLVRDWKAAKVDESGYRSRYMAEMRASYRKNKGAWLNILKRDVVTFVCFEKAGEFCHRLILAAIFEKLGATYAGERSVAVNKSNLPKGDLTC
jgi:uncharacterized protein YeaO (DUF488 family)